MQAELMAVAEQILSEFASLSATTVLRTVVAGADSLLRSEPLLVQQAAIARLSRAVTTPPGPGLAAVEFV